MIDGVTVRQLMRFGTVGLISNAVLYAVYLALTHYGLGAKLSMTLLYAAGVIQTFIFNKRWSFLHLGSHGPPFVRYCLSYALGYLVNLLALFVFVDRLG